MPDSEESLQMGSVKAALREVSTCLNLMIVSDDISVKRWPE